MFMGILHIKIYYTNSWIFFAEFWFCHIKSNKNNHFHLLEFPINHLDVPSHSRRDKIFISINICRYFTPRLSHSSRTHTANGHIDDINWKKTYTFYKNLNVVYIMNIYHNFDFSVFSDLSFFHNTYLKTYIGTC